MFNPMRRGVVLAGASRQLALRAEPPRPRVVCYGAVCIDIVTSVPSYPAQDEKMRALSWCFEGGGNAGNVATALSRLGITSRVLTKLGDDWFGEQALEALQADEVDCSEVVVKHGVSSPFTYLIVDGKAKTRTCIHHPLSEEMTVEEVSSSWLDGVEAAYFDSSECTAVLIPLGYTSSLTLLRLPVGAVRLAAICVERLVPVFLDAEKPRPGLDQLLTYTTYLHTNSAFPTIYTKTTDVLQAVMRLLAAHKNIRFVTTTLGAKGAILVMRATTQQVTSLASLDQLMKVGSGHILHQKQSYQFLYARSEVLSSDEVVDTTGCGDAFAAAVIFWLSRHNWLLTEPIAMLRFGNYYAAAKTKAPGAQRGLLAFNSIKDMLPRASL